jgi:hypothetical protein
MGFRPKKKKKILTLYLVALHTITLFPFMSDDIYHVVMGWFADISENMALYIFKAK